MSKGDYRAMFGEIGPNLAFVYYTIIPYIIYYTIKITNFFLLLTLKTFETQGKSAGQ